MIFAPTQYAEAVLSLELSDKAQSTFEKYLAAFNTLLRENKKLRSFLLDPTGSREKQEKWLTDTTNKEFARFLLTVIRNGDIDKLRRIHDRLLDARTKKEGAAQVVFTSATPLSAVTHKHLEATMAKKLGKDIIATHNVDENLLGGIRIQIGDEVIDDSILSKITYLKKVLSSTKA